MVQPLFFLNSNSNFKPPVMCGCSPFVSDLVRNPKDSFSHDVAHFIPCNWIPEYEYYLDTRVKVLYIVCIGVNRFQWVIVPR